MTSKMFDYLRYALYALLIVISMQLFQAWNLEHPHSTETTTTQSQTTSGSDYVPAIPTTTSATPATTQTNSNYVSTVSQRAAAAAPVTSAAINVTTDVMNVDISPQGDIVKVQLIKISARITFQYAIFIIEQYT